MLKAHHRPALVLAGVTVMNVASLVLRKFTFTMNHHDSGRREFRNKINVMRKTESDGMGSRENLSRDLNEVRQKVL